MLQLKRQKWKNEPQASSIISDHGWKVHQVERVDQNINDFFYPIPSSWSSTLYDSSSCRCREMTGYVECPALHWDARTIAVAALNSVVWRGNGENG